MLTRTTLTTRYCKNGAQRSYDCLENRGNEAEFILTQKDKINSSRPTAIYIFIVFPFFRKLDKFIYSPIFSTRLGRLKITEKR